MGGAALDAAPDLFDFSRAVPFTAAQVAPRPGRPPGARNKVSRDLAELAERWGGHPILAWIKIVATPIEVLKAQLGCTRLEAFDRWSAAANALAPYVASKMPLAVALSGKVASFSVAVPAAPGGAPVTGPDAVLALFQAAAVAAGIVPEDGAGAVIDAISESVDET